MTSTKKFIFLDIDGTLTEPGCNVPPKSALEAIRCARANGHKVFLCSGRNRGMLSPLLSLGFDGYISSSGGYVVCDDAVIYDSPMPTSDRLRVLDILHKNNIFCTVEARDTAYTDEGFKKYLEENSSAPGNSELLRWRKQVESALDIRPMGEYKDEPIYKIVLLATNEHRLYNAVDLLKNEFNIVIQGRQNNTSVINGEMQSKAFDKGTGIRIVCHHLNVPLEDTIGFGDSMNDKEMMETVGLSVCMGNGSDAMKEISHIICPAVSEDGLYKAFDDLGLITPADKINT